ncbi:MAG TPA: hypothetical protein PKV84_01630, partial [Candidatus Omnitrophota bacterium]|nr:hypothetical protein [Candidatus Omnitrophota bacterium]
RGLKRGEAALIWKNPSLLTDHIKLDFFGYSSYPDEFDPKTSVKKPVKTKRSAPEEKDTALDEIDNPLEIIKKLEEEK